MYTQIVDPIIFHLKYLKKTLNKIRYYIINYTQTLSHGVERPELWIDDEHKLIYIVIAKSACTSIKKSLFRMKFRTTPPTNIHGCTTASQMKFPNANHIRVHEYFVFTFVRNPIARVESCYKNKFMRNLRQENKNFIFSSYLNGYLRESDSFSTFVQKILIVPWKYCERHFTSQHYWIYKKCRLKPHFIGKVENLDTDWKYLQSRFPALPDIDHENQSPNEVHLSAELPQKLKDKLRKKYAKDIQAFNYKD